MPIALARVAGARAHVEPTCQLSGSSDINTPGRQSMAASDGSGAHSGSAPGSSRPCAVDTASVSVTVSRHPTRSLVARTVEASLHLAFGLGSGWTLVDAMMIEVARMGQTQPEGLALATVLSGWGTVANVMVVPLFYSLQRRLSWRIERWVWVGLLLQLSSAVLAALSWRVTLGPTSPCLYAVFFLACIGGNFQRITSRHARPAFCAVLPHCPHTRRPAWAQMGGSSSPTASRRARLRVGMGGEHGLLAPAHGRRAPRFAAIARGAAPRPGRG